jgi:cytochrome c oxidase cbb3-type subunit 3
MGKPKFGVCAACHGNDGKGNKQIGAPNLTDDVWLYGGGLRTIQHTINEGKQNNMPAFGSLLGGDNELARAKAKVLAAYVWGLSNDPQAK